MDPFGKIPEYKFCAVRIVRVEQPPMAEVAQRADEAQADG
jgi:hypothetical protein